MKTEHTPGPWYYTPRNTHRTSAGVDLVCITVMPAGDYRGAVADLQSCDHIQGITMAECEANARLIAAAPDLLAAGIAALKLLETMNQQQVWRNGYWDKEVDLRAAIAKARGEA